MVAFTLFACALAATSIPFVQTIPSLATIPAIVPTPVPGTVFVPLTQTTIPAPAAGTIPGTVIVPSTTNAPVILTGNIGIMFGKCSANCTPISQTTSQSKGVNGVLTCQSAFCPNNKRQGNVSLAVFTCLQATTQTLCDECFFNIRCNNAFGLTSTQISTFFGVCECLATGVSGCPSCNTSKKGLLGLLGLLGLIPLLLLLLLCCLCFMRRSKRQSDVQFATFDPAGPGVPHGSICPPMPATCHGGAAPPCF
jgi:hypothetical protein